MDILDFIKDKWNIVLGISLAIVVVITDFIIHPKINLSLAAGQVNFDTFSKFIVAAVILLLLVPANIFRSKRYKYSWWTLAIFTFVLSIYLFFYYNSYMDEVSVETDLMGREIVGVHLTNMGQKDFENAKKIDGFEYSKKQMIESFGIPPSEIWLPSEVHRNSRNAILLYLVTIMSFALFILFSIQAIYCTNSID
jgi:hypothetical protein